MIKKFSLEDIRKKNYGDVFALIYRDKSISKQGIANALQMSLPTVTQHLASLCEDGLVVKQGQISSFIGRKAAAYAIRPEARASVGVEIQRDKVSMVVVNLYGELIGGKTLPLHFSQEDGYFDALTSAVKVLVGECGLPATAILGAGFGLQGLVSEDGREIIYGKILDCTGMTIDRIAQHLPYPCRFIHDVECAAVLEMWDSPELQDALYISLGMHLGGAVISDGKIKAGRTGWTGTFEHMTLVEGGKLCYCGKHGCMECYCAAEALLESGGTLDEFFVQLRRGGARQQARWGDYLGYMALAINNLHMVLDDEIILGGHIAPYLTQFDLDELFASVQRRSAFPESENFLRIGTQRNDIIAMGAAIPAVSRFLAAIAP